MMAREASSTVTRTGHGKIILVGERRLHEARADQGHPDAPEPEIRRWQRIRQIIRAAFEAPVGPPWRGSQLTEG